MLFDNSIWNRFVRLAERSQTQSSCLKCPRGRDCLNCDLSRMPAKGWVFDMVTDPPETPLIAGAKSRGLASVTGLEMLVEQAATSFKLLFGADPPRDRDADLWHRLRP